MQLRIVWSAVVLIACAAPTAQAPPTPVANAAPTADPPATDALCCCTFDSAGPADFPEVNTWESLATLCPSGDGRHAPGQCIPWQYCDYAPGEEPRTLAERPALAPRYLAAGECCCAGWSGTGETFNIAAKDTCARTQHAACIAAAFCEALEATPDAP